MRKGSGVGVRGQGTDKKDLRGQCRRRCRAGELYRGGIPPTRPPSGSSSLIGTTDTSGRDPSAAKSRLLPDGMIVDALQGSPKGYLYRLMLELKPLAEPVRA